MRSDFLSSNRISVTANCDFRPTENKKYSREPLYICFEAQLNDLCLTGVEKLNITQTETLFNQKNNLVSTKKNGTFETAIPSSINGSRLAARCKTILA
jgi:hypothetical protein